MSINGSAQNAGQTANANRGLMIEINIIETTGAQRSDIAKMENGGDQLNRIIAEGKARLTGVLQIRTRIGENFSARLGERVPIQSATLPTMRTYDRTSGPAREPNQTQSPVVGIPQVVYENTGLSVDGNTTASSDGLVDIRLKIEMTGLDHSTGTLTPTFTQRTFTDSVRMKESETAMLVGFVQPEGRKPSIDEIASGASRPARGGFLVLLITRPVH
jgi:hypothetical protein